MVAFTMEGIPGRKSIWNGSGDRTLTTRPKSGDAVECLRAVEAAGEKIERFNDDIAGLVKGWSLYPLVQALQALRGVSLVAAAVIVSELGDLSRFENPTLLMSYLGLVPSEYSSGEKRHQGRITRTGNSLVRRVLVEAAWGYRFSPKRSYELRKRSEGVSTEVQEIAWKAQLRLHKKYRKLLARGKNIQKVMTAVARELVGFIWAIGKQPKLLAS
jgi:transposase